MGAAFPILALALTATGTGMNMAANAKANSRANQRIADEMARQRMYDKQSQAAFQNQLGGTGPEFDTKAQSQGAERRLSTTNEVMSQLQPRVSESPLVATQSAVTNPTRENRRQQSSQNMASLGGLREVDLRNAIRNLRTNQQLAIIGRNASGSANVMPYEIQDALRSTQGLAGAGQLTSALGSMLGMYGAYSGAGKAASAPAAAGTKEIVDPTAIYGSMYPYNTPPTINMARFGLMY